MADIAFLLLCHKDPAAVIAQARRLTAAGDRVVIHHDASAPRADHARLRAALDPDPRVAFAHRHRCGWGQWSLVAATLDAARTALSRFPEVSHLYLISGDCQPIKPAEHLRARLDARDVDHIECHDFLTSGWIRTGWCEERLIYRHLVNERRHRRLFYALFEVQKRLRLARPTPPGLHMRIGPQWWCLRRATMERLLAHVDAHPELLRFFRTTWIPDESFFQTLTAHLVPKAEISGCCPTFLMFTDYGMPVTFHNDHHDLLLGQDAFFARKISPGAEDLKARLGALYGETGREIAITGEGRALHAFVTAEGRRGRRVAPRFWEDRASLGPGRDLHVIVARKRHVAKRLVGLIRSRADLPLHDYVFSEEEAGLPDLGGLERGMAKRHRHRRALLRLLFEHHDSRSLLFCADPGDLALLRDLAQDPARLHLLEIETALADAYLTAHARRIGLAAEATPDAGLAALLPTLRNRMAAEDLALRDARLPRHHRLAETAPPEENARALAAFLAIAPEIALEMARTPGLFAD